MRGQAPRRPPSWARRRPRAPPSSSGSPTTTSPSSATATPTGPDWGLSRLPGEGSLRGPEQRVRSDHAHQGERAVDRPPPRLSGLRGSRRALLPRPVHAHRLPVEPDRDPDPAPPRRRGAREGRASRRAATTRRRCSRSWTPTRATSCSRSPRTSSSTPRWGSSISASASACGCSPAATLSAASSRCSCSCRATASTPRTGAARGDPADRHRRDEHRLHNASVRVRARAAALRGLRRARRRPRLRRRRGRDDARSGHALVGR